MLSYITHYFLLMGELQMKKSVTKGLIIAAVAIVAVIILSVSICVSIPTGHTGVVTTFGRVESYVLDEGIHFKLPWQKVVTMDNRTQKGSVTMQAFSSDIQQVDVICTVNYGVNRSTSQDLYKNVGVHYYDTVMLPRINESIKSVFSKYTAESLVGQREKLSTQILEILLPEMNSYGIDVSAVSVENIDFTDVFTDAVEAKQVAEQAKLQATIEQEQKTIEEKAIAERKAISAEAEANVQKIQADAEAYATKVQAEADAEANSKIAASMTQELLKYLEIKQWNGILPKIYSGNGGSLIPIINGLNDSEG